MKFSKKPYSPDFNLIETNNKLPFKDKDF